MTHDIEDLLNLIKELEERIIELEKLTHSSSTMDDVIHGDDAWYWDH